MTSLLGTAAPPPYKTQTGVNASEWLIVILWPLYKLPRICLLKLSPLGKYQQYHSAHFDAEVLLFKGNEKKQKGL